MRLFVTGATGFIGSHFVQRALAAGHGVTALRRSTNSQPRIPLTTQPRWLMKSMEAVNGGDMRETDALVHLAAAGVSSQQVSWKEMFEANVLHSLQLWQTAAVAGVRRIVVCGSCFEYGRSADRHPLLRPDSPLEPTTAYGASKAAASLAAIGLAAEHRLEVVVARLFHVFGEGEDSTRFWPSLRSAALDGRDFPMTVGDQVRDFVPVEHAADEILAAASRDDVLPGRAVVENVGTGRPRTLRAFAEEWWARWKATGQLQFGAIPYRDGEVMRYVPAVDGAVDA